MRAIPLVVLAALCCSAAVAEPVLTPLLVTGRGGFGVPGATALSFNSLRLDPTGGVAARVILDGAGIDFDNNVAVLAGTGGPMSVVAREGDPVPGVAGATFTNVFALTVAGDVAGVLGRFSGPGVTAADDEALWRYDAGAPTLLARSNEVVPGGTTERFTAFDQIAIDGAGNATVVAATTASNRFRQAIYTDRTGTLQPVFRLGDPVPGTGNKTADLIGALEPAPDSDRVFWAELDSSQSFVDFQSDEVLVRERNGQLSLVLREGVAAPGAPGFEFGEIGGLNGIGGFRPLGGGRIGLRLDLRPAFGSADESAWAFDNGALSLLARTGDVVDGRVVNRVSTPEWISGDSWLIDVSVDGTDDAVLRSDAGTLSTVLATGDAMPDSADTFDNLRLLGRGGGSTYVSASRPLGVESLWAIADGAAPVRLLTEGQAVNFVGDPAGTPASTISSIALQAVRPDGDLTVQLLFTDGSQGVFLLDAPGGGFPAGDYNRDGVVTQADYAVWAAEFGTAASNADGNEDGAINAADYTVWRAAFQTAAATPAPEPTTAATVAATPLAWTRGRRRR